MKPGRRGQEQQQSASGQTSRAKPKVKVKVKPEYRRPAASICHAARGTRQHRPAVIRPGTSGGAGTPESWNMLLTWNDEGSEVLVRVRSVAWQVSIYRSDMDVDWNAELIDQLESHWQQRLRPRLNGLTDDEYFWQPVPGCWTVSRRGQSKAPDSFGEGEFTMDYVRGPQDREPVTTIAWRLGHLTVLFAATNVHFGSPPADHATFRYSGTAKEALLPTRRRPRRVYQRPAQPRRGGACPAAGSGQSARVRRRANGQALSLHQPGDHPPRRGDIPAS